jgi:hypothetical protein
MFVNTELRKVSGPNREKVKGEWRKLRSFIICTAQMTENYMGGSYSTHRDYEKYLQNFGQNLNRRARVVGSIILKRILEKHDVRIRSGFIRLKIGSSSGIF